MTRVRVFILSFLVCLSSLTIHAADKPNIILIFADDLGWKDVGYQGTDFYETPNIDRLAKEGMVFSAGYSSAGNCKPSRACLLSGQYTPRHEVYAVGNTNRGPANLMRMVPIPNRRVEPSVVTVAEALKAGGYRTGIFGKWHLSVKPGEQGFDVVMDKNSKSGPVNPDPKGIYTITAAACRFMEANRERPFFAYVSHHAIHTAHHTRQATLDKFNAKTPGKQHRKPVYAGCTYDLDDGVGILLKKLDDLGLSDNTLVVFTSDNGATPASPQEPLRGNKGSYHEGGIREPFIVRWPGVVKPGTRSDVPVINVDLYPTFLDAAGAAPPTGQVLDGESFIPLLRGADSLKRTAIFWHFPGYLNTAVIRGRDPVFRTRPVSVINKDHWKLYLYHEEWQLDGGRDSLATNKSVELYNLRDDVGERNDLVNSHAEKRDELLNDLLGWMKTSGAKLPTMRNPKYDPDAPVVSPKKKKKKDRKKNTGDRFLSMVQFCLF